MEPKFWKSVFASMLGFILASMAFMLLLFIVIGVSVASLGGDEEKTIHVGTHSILSISPTLAIVENSNEDPFSKVMGGGSPTSITMYDAIRALEKAKTDESIDGVYINISDLPCGSANVEDLRQALLDFKTSKKFIYAYSETYSQGGYYLASVADSVFVNPQGGAIIKGLVAKVSFYKNALEKLGIEPQIIRHGKFKSAIEPYILDKMSPENREQISKILQVSWSNYLNQVGQARKIDPSVLDSLVDHALLSDAKSCLDHKIVDQIKYEDEVLELLKTKTEASNANKLSFVKLEKYVATLEKSTNTQKIALVYADGSISDGKGDDGIHSTNFVNLLRKIRYDDNIKGVVLRINSPGGSSLASDIIWRELELLKQAKKPLVVSMANVAASGGYYMAIPADRIFAYPTTITGSIGVFGVIPNTKPLVTDKIGITFDTVKTNKYADILTVNRPLAEDEKAIIQAQVERIYDEFITKVAQGRKLQKADVDSIAQGRVWMGADALKIGLVDELGGIQAAVKHCILLTKIDSNDLSIVQYPEPDAPFTALQKKLNGTTQLQDQVLKTMSPEVLKTYKLLQQTFQQKGILAQMEFVFEIN